MSEQLKGRIVDDVLETLADGKFHTVEQIVFGCRHLNENQVEAILSFFSRFGFVERKRKTWSTRTRVAKLTPDMVNFLKHIWDLEGTV